VNVRSHTDLTKRHVAVLPWRLSAYRFNQILYLSIVFLLKATWVNMPPKIDIEAEISLRSDSSCMPKSKQTGDNWLTEKVLEITAAEGVLCPRAGRTQ
jgi:hypothetical protein